MNLCSALALCITNRTACAVLHKGPEHVMLLKLISCMKETFVVFIESLQYYLPSKYCDVKPRECLFLQKELPFEVLKSFEPVERCWRNPLKVAMTETDTTVLLCNLLIYCKLHATSWSYTWFMLCGTVFYEKIKIYLNSGHHQKLIHYKMIKKRSLQHDNMTCRDISRGDLKVS